MRNSCSGKKTTEGYAINLITSYRCVKSSQPPPPSPACVCTLMAKMTAKDAQVCHEPKKRRINEEGEQGDSGKTLKALKSSYEASGYRKGRKDGPIRCLWHPGVDPLVGKEFHANLGKPRPKPQGVHDNVLGMIGHTPMVRVQKIASEEGVKCDLVAKCEFMSAGGSVKDRVALQMIEEAEKSGRIKPGDTLIEPTSGNTGIGLAMVAAIKGYRSVITLPEKMSNEKVNSIYA